MAWERRQRGGCTLYRSSARGQAERASILSGVPREEIEKRLGDVAPTISNR